MEQTSIRSIQHYLYCPHRWGLIVIDQAWEENYFIAKAQVVHKRADTVSKYDQRGKKVYTAVRVWNDEFGLYGVTDCIEKDETGYSIVEYKPTAPKIGTFRDEDAIQVFAQKLCVDQVLCCNSRGVLYYADQKKRVELPFEAEYDNYVERIKSILSEMHYLLEKGIIPPVKENQYCNGCSMKDACLPSALNKSISVRKQAFDFAGEDV